MLIQKPIKLLKKKISKHLKNWKYTNSMKMANNKTSCNDLLYKLEHQMFYYTPYSKMVANKLFFCLHVC